MADDKTLVRFGADGIRGVVGQWPFVLPGAMRIGQALGRYLKARLDHASIVIGCDTRPSGTGLTHAMAAGLLDQGADVINLGVMTTPGVAFLTRWTGSHLGVIISASHSSYEYNGIKLVDGRGLRLQGEHEERIEALIHECLSRGVDPAAVPGQETPTPNLIELYIQDHVRRFLPNSLEDLCVVLDCAEGAASQVAPQAFERLGARVIAVNDRADGKNINHRCGSEHARKRPADLVNSMNLHDAEYGFAFDGDGDRLVVVDRSARVYDGYDLLFVLARHFQKQGLLRHDVVVTDFRANLGLEASLRCCGIRTVYTLNGDRNLEAEMWEKGYLLGGESGGNILINDGDHAAADAVYAALMLGRVLVENRPATLYDLVAPLRRHPQVNHSIDLHGMSLTDAQRVTLEKLRQRQEEELGPGSRILVWDSTTEPGVFRIQVEGTLEHTQAQVEEIANSMIEWIEHPVV